MIHQFDFVFDRHRINDLVAVAQQRDRRLHVLAAAGLNLSVAASLYQKVQDQLALSRFGFSLVDEGFDTISFMGLNPGAVFFFDDVGGGPRKSQSVDLVRACLRAGGTAFVLVDASSENQAKRCIHRMGLADQHSRLAIEGVVSPDR